VNARSIVFLSDYGLEDEFVGICHAVMTRVSPGSRIIDLSHAVPPQDVFRGALILHRAISYLPSEAVVLAIVDPGVGMPRRPIAARTSGRGRLLVGPDNGVLSLAWHADGGVEAAREIASTDVILEPVSRTFHGRDVFAPAAASLAKGVPLDDLGPAVDPAALVAMSLPSAGVEPGLIEAEILDIDRFGNVQLSARPSDLRTASLEDAAELELTAGEWSTKVRRVAAFGDVVEGEFGLIVDSSGWLALVINRGSAAEALSLTAGDPVSLQAWGSDRNA
jgi:S-adenosylmethionine hydrolase